MKNERQMIQELQIRKLALIQRLKELNAEGPADGPERDGYNSEKNKIERELVEVMDRLIQLNYIVKK